MDFSVNLKLLRQARGMTQSELAKELNVSGGLIGFYETGDRRPSYEQLDRIAAFFDVGLDELMGRDTSEGDMAAAKSRQTAVMLEENSELSDLIETAKELSKDDLVILTQLAKRLKEKTK